MVEPTKKSFISAEKWIKFYEDMYIRNEHDVIIDEPYVLEKFEHDGRLYLKDNGNWLYDPIKCNTVSESEIPLVWNPETSVIEGVGEERWFDSESDDSD